MYQLTCQNLSIGYDGKAVARGIDFAVKQGDYLCIVGENGAGKSTLMKTVLGLQKPLSGKITTGESLKSNEIGYLPQQTSVQKDFPASVREIVLSGFQGRCGIRPFYSKEEKKLAEDMMEKMHISHLAKKCYRELSGGQQQRVLLARALCSAGKILVLDEPASGFDPNASKRMYQLIQSLNRKDGLTIIMVTHDMDAVSMYASHILHVGESVFFGTKDEYIKSPQGKAFEVKEEVIPGE